MQIRSASRQRANKKKNKKEEKKRISNISLIVVNLVALQRNPFGPMRWWKRWLAT